MALSSTYWMDNPASAQYTPQIFQAAAANGISPDVLGQYIQNESNFNPNATNPLSSATGLGQILSSTASDPGYGIAPVNPSDPNASINFIAQYIAQRGISGTSGTYTQDQLLSAAGIDGTSSTSAASPPFGGSTDSASATPASSLLGTGGGSASSGTATAGGGTWTLAQYFEAAVVIILGLILIAVGLTYFSHPSGGFGAAVRRTAEGAALA